MRVSFIVSAFDRPEMLTLCLCSLRVQSYRDYEVIVTDNATDPGVSATQRQLVESMGDRFQYHRPQLTDCYESANWGAKLAQGEYLCFPSDDGYYAPRFLELLLRAGEDADLIYCDCIWDCLGHYGPGNECIHLDVAPVTGKIDKGGFLLRRSKFTEFDGPVGISRAADGWLVERVVRESATHKKVPIVGWIHN